MSARILILFATLAFMPLAASADAGSRHVAGPVAADLIRVIDGDTLLVSAAPWPDHRVTTYVRLRGIDAPELKSKCPEIRRAALEAQEALAAMVIDGSSLLLKDISGDKYYGRVLARVILPDGTDPASTLLAEGLVDPYQGGRKTRHACN